jgi:hypothetical protein
MNTYEQKQEARRERLAARAERLAEKSQQAFARSSRAMDGIPFGQPILVGHHSEGRHRAALKRSDNAMRQCCELLKQANETARRAESIGSGGISSDDPDAVTKLEQRLAELEAKRIKIKARDHESWELSNLAANIRRIKQRIAELKRPAPKFNPIDTPLYSVTLDVEENRIVLKLKERISKEAFKGLRHQAWLWSPTRNAFVKKLSAHALMTVSWIKIENEKEKSNESQENEIAQNP